jgi:hypothetical protein
MGAKQRNRSKKKRSKIAEKSLSRSQHQESSRRNQPPEEASEKREGGDGQMPIEPKIHQSPRDDDKTNHQVFCKPDATPIWKISLEIGAFVAALAIGVIYWGQLRQMIQSNRINREALESVQRASISYNGTQTAAVNRRITPESNVQDFISFNISWRNAGNTNALSVVHYFSVEPVKDSEFSRFPFTEPSGLSMSPQVLGPGSFLQPHPIEKHAEEVLAPFIDAISKGTTPNLTSHWIEWGWIGYRDIFNNLHVTETCWRVAQAESVEAISRVKGEPQGTQSGYQIGLESCSRHNCADNDCEDYQRIASLIPRPSSPLQ